MCYSKGKIAIFLHFLTKQKKFDDLKKTRIFLRIFFGKMLLKIVFYFINNFDKLKQRVFSNQQEF